MIEVPIETTDPHEVCFSMTRTIQRAFGARVLVTTDEPTLHRIAETPHPDRALHLARSLVEPHLQRITDDLVELLTRLRIPPPACIYPHKPHRFSTARPASSAPPIFVEVSLALPSMLAPFFDARSYPIRRRRLYALIETHLDHLCSDLRRHASPSSDLR